MSSLAELKALPVADCEAEDFHPAVRELTHFRHVDHDLTGRSSFSEYDITDFLSLCGVAEGPLLNGHTPLNRETGWQWVMGKRNRVIFGAGREIGYAVADDHGVRFVRMGRTLLADDDSVLFSRADDSCRELGESPLQPDQLYRFNYEAPLTIGPLVLRHHRHLAASLRAGHTPGFYLTERRLVKLKKHDTVMVGADMFASLNDPEAFLLTQVEEGEFEIRALVVGITVG